MSAGTLGQRRDPRVFVPCSGKSLPAPYTVQRAPPAGHKAQWQPGERAPGRYVQEVSQELAACCTEECRLWLQSDVELLKLQRLSEGSPPAGRETSQIR